MKKISLLSCLIVVIGSVGMVEGGGDGEAKPAPDSKIGMLKNARQDMTLNKYITLTVPPQSGKKVRTAIQDAKIELTARIIDLQDQQITTIQTCLSDHQYMNVPFIENIKQTIRTNEATQQLLIDKSEAERKKEMLLLLKKRLVYFGIPGVLISGSVIAIGSYVAYRLVKRYKAKKTKVADASIIESKEGASA